MGDFLWNVGDWDDAGVDSVSGIHGIAHGTGICSDDDYD
jgi:hypothetical protein